MADDRVTRLNGVCNELTEPVTPSDTGGEMPEWQHFLFCYDETNTDTGGLMTVVTRAGSTRIVPWSRGVPIPLRVKQIRATGTSNAANLRVVGAGVVAEV